MKKIFFSFIVCLLMLIFTKIIAQNKYEFRGVWVATVGNIDFPSSKFLSTEHKKKNLSSCWI